MADNLELNLGSGGATLATAEVTFSGDTADVQICGVGLMSGSAESYTMAFASAGAGAVGTGVQRVTLASNDPAVAHLANIVTAVQLIDNAVSGAGFNITQFAGAAVPIGAGVEATALRVTLANDSTGTLTVDTTGTSGLEVVQATAADLNVTEASAADIKTAVELIDNAVDGNYLNVNLNAAGTDLAMNAGAMSAQTVRTTLATDDTHYGAVGAASDIDGVVHGQLRYVADQLVTIDADTDAIKTATELIDDTVAVLGTATYSEANTKGNVIGAVRNDDLATLANTDNEIAPLQVDNRGAVYVNQAAAEPKQASGVAVGGAPGTDDMIAAVPGKKLLILAFSLFATSTTTNTIYVDNADNDLLGNSGNGIALSLDADADTIPGIIMQYNPGGWFKTDTVNEAVTLNTSAAEDIIWSITWIETD